MARERNTNNEVQTGNYWSNPSMSLDPIDDNNNNIPMKESTLSAQEENYGGREDDEYNNESNNNNDQYYYTQQNEQQQQQQPKQERLLRRERMPPSTAKSYDRQKGEKTTFRSGTPATPDTIQDFYDRMFYYGFQYREQRNQIQQEMKQQEDNDSDFGLSNAYFDPLKMLLQEQPPPRRNLQPRVQQDSTTTKNTQTTTQDDEYYENYDNNNNNDENYGADFENEEECNQEYQDKTQENDYYNNYYNEPMPMREQQQPPPPQQQQDYRQSPRQQQQYQQQQPQRRQQQEEYQQQQFQPPPPPRQQQYRQPPRRRKQKEQPRQRQKQSSRQQNGDWVDREVSGWFENDDNDNYQQERPKRKANNNQNKNKRRNDKNGKQIEQQLTRFLDGVFNLNREAVNQNYEMYERALGNRPIPTTNRQRQSSPRRGQQQQPEDNNAVIASLPIKPQLPEHESVSPSLDRPTLSWEDRSRQLEQVPPPGIAAWGPSGDLNMDAQTKAYQTAISQVEKAQANVETKEEQTMDARRAVTLCRTNVRLASERLRNFKNNNRPREEEEQLERSNMELEDAIRHLQFCQSIEQKARNQLENIKDKHWAILHVCHQAADNEKSKGDEIETEIETGDDLAVQEFSEMATPLLPPAMPLPRTTVPTPVSAKIAALPTATAIESQVPDQEEDKMRINEQSQ